ncbi:MAG: glutamine synthetase, partial [Paracoccaceae bacterium]|nr:glutamine synthetase [Paracoccaceae bacterium]
IETGDGFEVTDATESTATDLAGATADLKTDVGLADAIGRTLIDNHVFMKEMEVEKTKNLNDEALRDFYINYI